MEQNQYLVVTAIGTNRTGMVGDLARLVHQCNCNILDSHMAKYGKEFTMLMMIAGNHQAINKAETMLPSTSHQLGLLTMLKRTSKSSAAELEFRPNFEQNLLIEFAGSDTPGTLKAITEFLAEQQVDICSLRTESSDDQAQQTHKTQMELQLEQHEDRQAFSAQLSQLCDQLKQQLTIKSTELIG